MIARSKAARPLGAAGAVSKGLVRIGALTEAMTTLRSSSHVLSHENARRWPAPRRHHLDANRRRLLY